MPEGVDAIFQPKIEQKSPVVQKEQPKAGVAESISRLVSKIKDRISGPKPDPDDALEDVADFVPESPKEVLSTAPEEENRSAEQDSEEKRAPLERGNEVVTGNIPEDERLNKLRSDSFTESHVFSRLEPCSALKEEFAGWFGNDAEMRDKLRQHFLVADSDARTLYGAGEKFRQLLYEQYPEGFVPLYRGEAPILAEDPDLSILSHEGDLALMSFSVSPSAAGSFAGGSEVIKRNIPIQDIVFPGRPGGEHEIIVLSKQAIPDDAYKAITGVNKNTPLDTKKWSVFKPGTGQIVGYADNKENAARLMQEIPEDLEYITVENRYGEIYTTDRSAYETALRSERKTTESKGDKIFPAIGCEQVIRGSSLPSQIEASSPTVPPASNV